jgi:hypothetical protein
MQRFLSAVVISSALALGSARAVAQPALPVPAGKTASEPPSRRADERLSDEAELSRVAGLYEAGKYRDCVSEVERLLDPLGKAPLRQAAIVENARVYWAACLMGAGEVNAADAPLRAAIHENPQMKPPDSLVFPQPVIQRFLKVRDSLVNEIRAAEQARIKQAQAEARQREQRLVRDRARMVMLETLAREQEVVVRNRRSLAFIPFGVGQIQNRQEALGYTLMASEVLLGTLSLVAIGAQAKLAVQVDDAVRQGKTVDEQSYERTKATWSTIKTTSAWAFFALAVGGVVHAQLEFVPEFRERRTRELPPALSARRSLELTAVAPYAERDGGGLSLSGRF